MCITAESRTCTYLPTPQRSPTPERSNMINAFTYSTKSNWFLTPFLPTTAVANRTSAWSVALANAGCSGTVFRKVCHQFVPLLRIVKLKKYHAKMRKHTRVCPPISLAANRQENLAAMTVHTIGMLDFRAATTRLSVGRAKPSPSDCGIRTEI